MWKAFQCDEVQVRHASVPAVCPASRPSSNRNTEENDRLWLSHLHIKDIFLSMPGGVTGFWQNIQNFQTSQQEGQQEWNGTVRRYQAEFGQSVRQITVRDFNTKDKPGTLPVSAYNPRAAQTNPLNTEVITPTITQKILLTSGSYVVLCSR